MRYLPLPAGAAGRGGGRGCGGSPWGDLTGAAPALVASAVPLGCSTLAPLRAALPVLGVS